ncbi:DUF2804 domain-containing protein [Janibacter cremeus]|uniref:DUF2804 domain-containing protein n=1 Tax=Janibacter cremeus TaxID=1285192 RepID=A0A852VQU4_9MICO|nr:DUF2804 domain-containing protein [Janibacter cremeus]NYF97083.1 hypothetical protein [Janibacter cremeus]
MSLPELTAPVSLTRTDGRLNPHAVGWARRPLVDTAGIGPGRGRNKRWEYWGIVTDTHLVGVTVSSIDFAAVHEVWVHEIASGREWHRSATLVPARGANLPASLGEGPVQGRARGLAVDIDEVEGATRLRARIEGAVIDVLAVLPPGHERLAVVVPWSATRFQYTVKDVARPATGTLTLDGRTHVLPEGSSWAVLDHGRGRWPHDIRWNWGAGSGTTQGRTIGVQVGGQWTQGTGSTENAVVIDGRLHHIPVELDFDYGIARWRQPWRITGGGLDATFTPFHLKATHTDLGLLAAHTDQCFGRWSGTFTDEGGRVTPFVDLTGWCEEVHNRW